MGADGVEECLEQGSVGCIRRYCVRHMDTESWDGETKVAVDRRGEEREAMPPISLHSKEATADQAQNEGGVGVDVKGLVWPSLDCLDSSAELSDVVRQTGA